MFPSSSLPWAAYDTRFYGTSSEAFTLVSLGLKLGPVTYELWEPGVVTSHSFIPHMEMKASPTSQGHWETKWVDVCMICSRVPTTHKASRKAVDSALGKWRVDPVWGHTPSIPPKDLSQLWMQNQWSNEPEDSQDGRKIPQGQFWINKLLLSFCLNFPIFNVGMTVFLMSLRSMKEYMIEHLRIL